MKHVRVCSHRFLLLLLSWDLDCSGAAYPLETFGLNFEVIVDITNSLLKAGGGGGGGKTCRLINNKPVSFAVFATFYGPHPRKKFTLLPYALCM